MDRSTIEGFRQGDPESLRVIYGHFAGPVATVARSVVGDDRTLIDDVVQQTFTRAWRAAERFDPNRDVAPWLYTIARSTAVDAARRERRPTRGDHEPEVDVAVTGEAMERMRERFEIRRAVDALPSEERDVVRLAHLLGLTHAEIADRLGVPLGTVESRSSRAHRRLATSLACLAAAPPGPTTPPGDDDPRTDPRPPGPSDAPLAEPALWAKPSPDVEARVLAAIAVELPTLVRRVGHPTAATPGRPVAAHLNGGPGRRARRLAALALAAGLAVVALGALSVMRSGVEPEVEVEEVALAAGAFDPDASAVAEIAERPNGFRIALDIVDLEPARPGTFYAAWLVGDDGSNRVGLGSFHLRGGDGSIELWSGVSLDDYPIVLVTLQPEESPTGPGEPVLRGHRSG
ncbi:MAG: RNA polymerase sigma factor [Acidimicrobiales bacterium]